ncbi:hypothetical protein ACFFGH_00215 [Lysobacter korlensis]|uniref:DUF4279 domain-containing protein n=1 Tax=Lysobacter korlensis TaxID=553636 RepID=A0ABV6RH22_9GAMM
MSLQLVHPQADLAPVFAALRLQPSHLHRRGDARHDADGARQCGEYRFSAGTALLSPPCGPDGRQPEPLDACLTRALTALTAHGPLLQACIDEGGRARIAVRLGERASTDWAPAAALADMLGSLGLELAVTTDDGTAGVDAGAR